MRNNEKTSRRKGSHRKLDQRSSRGSVPLPQAINFEPLETRRLLATINVTDFGARPNDGGDDRGALNAAINASRPGDTIRFAGGTFDFGGEIVFASDRNYTGSGATLRGRGPGGNLVKILGDNVSVTRLTFDGGGFFLERSGGRNSNIVFDHNVFRQNTSGLHPSSITFTSGLSNSKITNNYFTGYNGGFGLYGYNYNNLTISNNEFIDLKAGMHIDAFGNSGNLFVSQNYLKGLKGMGMEFQGTANNLKFYDNFYEKPNLSSQFNQNMNSFAYSLILDKSSNIEIKRNTVIAPERPDGVGCRVGFEVGGDNTIVEENYVNGVNHVLASNDGVGSSSVLLKNNKFMNYLQGIGGIRPGAIRYEGTNDASTRLSWDINRPRPGIDGTISVPPPSNSTAPAAPTNLAAMVTGATTVNLFWSDKATDESGYKVERSVDGGQTWAQIAQLPAGSATYSVSGLTAGHSYSFRVRAFNDNGNSGYSSSAAATPAAFDARLGTFLSDLPWMSSSKNGWGAPERDMSNGENRSGDGRAITLDGKTYAKGIGVHALSEIRVQLDGKYASFLADIGVDDESGSNGSVVFHVYADDVKLYESGTMTGDSQTRSIKLDVRGRKELTLIVSGAGEDINFDHADWANARLVSASPAPNPDPKPLPEPEPEPEPSNVVYLSDMNWSEAANGWGVPELDQSNGERLAGDGKTLTINGRQYKKGLGVHANSEIKYALDGKYTSFITDIGLDQEVGKNGAVVFHIYADGMKLYESGTVRGGDAARTLNLDVTGKQQLCLIVSSAKDGMDFDHANWANARLVVAPKPVTPDWTYISDFKIQQKTNGWGDIELDSSVGEKLSDDGRTIKLNGKSYAKGIGVHADSKLVYALDGKYTTFSTDLGIDDEVGDKGSAVFEIWADGAKLYDSGKMTGASATKTAVVNVAGKKQLWLVVGDAGDGKDFDHADWASARLAA